MIYMMDTRPEIRRRRSSFGSFRRSSKLLADVSRRLSWKPSSDGDGVDWWQCKHCTYRNHNVEYLSCEVCGIIRPIPPAKAILLSTKDLQITDPSTGSTNSKDADSSDKQAFCVKERSEDEQKIYRKALIQERMEEIVQRQRCLYDEIMEKRVRHESIPYHMETQKSIENLQKILKNDAFSVPSSLEIKEASETQNTTPNLSYTSRTSTATTTSTGTTVKSPVPERRPSPQERTRIRAPRRVVKRANQYENPANTMKNSPWEDRTLGVDDILNVQEELWDRVNGMKEQDKVATHPRRFSLFRGKRAKRN